MLRAMLRALRNFVAADSRNRRLKIRNKLQWLFGRLAGSLAKESSPGYWAFRPDSAWLFETHPEFASLFKVWTVGNSTNNAGDRARYYSLILNLKQVIADGVVGDFAELGVYLGNSSALFAHFAAESGRKLFLFDTFYGFDAADLTGGDAAYRMQFADTTLAKAQKLIGHEGICRYVVGKFPESITEESKSSRYAFVSLDCDLYKPMRDGLAFFYERLSPGGMLFVHDYSSCYWDGVKSAVDEFSRQTGATPVLLPDKSGTAVIRKGTSAGQ
jgi:hypothetical protein